MPQSWSNERERQYKHLEDLDELEVLPSGEDDPLEANEADVAEQRREVPLEDDRYPSG